MAYITVDEATIFVRYRMDEYSSMSSEILRATVDDTNLNDSIAGHIEEAIKVIHLAAPSPLMEGIVATKDTDASWSVDSDQVGTLTFLKDTLRLVTLRSGGVLIEPIPENSNLARLQTNKYLRGTAKDPVLVQLHTTSDYLPVFKLYIAEGSTMPEVVYFPKPVLDETNGYYVSAQLKDAVLNQLTGMVLDSYEKNQMAQVFYAKAAEYLK